MTKNWNDSDLPAKMAENSLWETLPSELRTKVASLVLSDQRKRKMNRISGHLKRRVAAPEAKSLAASIDNMILGPYGLLHSWCHEAKPNEEQFYLNNQLFAALLMTDADKSVTDHYAKLLSEQWKKRNHDDEVWIIAHRGDGATYEKVRKVFERDQFDYLYKHENENSKAAVEKALEAWHGKKLRGIECDVWFSQDNYPIVTHTKEVGDLLKREDLAEGGTGKTTLGNRKIDKIDQKDLTLTGRFLTLKEWLRTINEYVRKHRSNIEVDCSLRIEIEMKDTKLDTGKSSNKQDVLKRWRKVERVVSRFLKTCERPSLYQIALFNGSEAPLDAKNKVQADLKTMLQGVVYGGSPEHPLHNDLHEVRYGLHSKGLLKRMKDGEFAGKILTLAPGVEAIPKDPPVQLKTLGEWIETPEALTLEQAVQCSRLRRIIGLNNELSPEKRPLRIQVLTDFGGMGANFIVQKQALPIGPIGPFMGPPLYNKLKCVFTKYKIDSVKQEEVTLKFATTKNHQKELMDFGMWFLKEIRDWA